MRTWVWSVDIYTLFIHACTASYACECDVVWAFKLVPQKMSLWKGRKCVDIYSLLQAYQKLQSCDQVFSSVFINSLYRAEPFWTCIFPIRAVRMEKDRPSDGVSDQVLQYIGLEGIRNFQVTALSFPPTQMEKRQQQPWNPHVGGSSYFPCQ